MFSYSGIGMPHSPTTRPVRAACGSRSTGGAIELRPPILDAGIGLPQCAVASGPAVHAPTRDRGNVFCDNKRGVPDCSLTGALA